MGVIGDPAAFYARIVYIMKDQPWIVWAELS
jgi:hypothetical protein